MTYLHDGAVQTNARGLTGSIERRIIDVRRADVLHRFTGNRIRDQPPNEEARDRGVPIREMNSRSPARADLTAVVTSGQVGQQPFGARLEVHPAESRKAVLPCEQRWKAVHTDAETACSLVPEEPQHLLVGLYQVEQEILVAHFRETNLLLWRRETGHVVGMRAGVQPQHVLLRLWRKRR